MKILNLKVNNFGKLNNKQVQFDSNINIVYGNNESGKSSLLKFIVGMFYGISKNKNGKEISDLDKYTPWSKEEFSGKLIYELDNGESYEIYREFKKKNPKIFNENAEDISKEFNIDKTKGNMFFYDQTGIEEELFLSTLVSQQQEVKLDQKSQNTLIQKISNLINTGEDNVSYQKTIKNLDKRLLEEVGTLRSQDRPINIIKKRIDEIKKEHEYLKPHLLQKYEINKQKEEYNTRLEKAKQKIEYLNQLKYLEDELTIENEKIEINKRIEKELADKLEELNKTKKQEISSGKNDKKRKIISPFIPICLFLITAIIAYLVKNITVFITIIILGILINAVYAIWYAKNRSIENKKNMAKQNEKINTEKEIQLTKNSIREQEQNIGKMQEKLELRERIEKDKLKVKYLGKIDEKDLNIDKHNIIIELNNIQTEYQNLVLKIKTLELEEKDILPRLDKLAGIEEELESLEEEEKELELKRECIEEAKQVITYSYEKMKNEISPQFASNISKQMEAISNGKYKKIKINDESGFTVEIENGNYIPGESLSIGTIDQLYLSLRLSVINDISIEKMPIILDETFAYFDDERLENILKFLINNYSDRQIIIFTCTTREKEALAKLNVKYNLVQM